MSITPPSFVLTSLKRVKSESTEWSPNDPYQVISEREFFEYFDRIKGKVNPFMELTELFVPVVASDGSYWARIIGMDSGVYLECQLAIDGYKSSYKKPDPETDSKYYYIDIFEHNRETGISSDQELVSIRISPDYEEGEWRWIRKGKYLSGNHSKRLAEIISRTMKIKNCFLVDNAQVPATDQKMQMLISPMMQLMGKPSYYEPTFSLFECKDFESDMKFEKTQKRVVYNQNTQEYHKELHWLRELKITVIYNDILVGFPRERAKFMKITKLFDITIRMKRIGSTKAMEDCAISLGQLTLNLYERAKKGEVRPKNYYEWIYFRFFETKFLNEPNETQARFIKATHMLTNNIRHADFSK